MHIFSFDHSLCIRTLVHDINFCDDTNCPYTLLVHFSSHLQTIRSCHIRICWQSTQNDSSGITHVSESHCTRDLLDIIRLI